MPNESVQVDFSKVVKNIRGEAVKDMIDQPANITPDIAPDLTLGSLFANGLTIGIQRATPKEALKYLRMAQKIEIALRDKKGIIEMDEGEISQLEEALAKIAHPLFSVTLYAGSMQEMIETAKLEILAKQKGK